MSTDQTTIPAAPQQPSLRIILDGEGGAVYGTRDGYAALASALMHAVDQPQRNAVGQLIAAPDVDQLIARDSDIPDFTLYVVEELPPAPAAQPPPGGNVVGWLFFGAIALLVALAAVGAGAIVNYFR